MRTISYTFLFYLGWINYFLSPCSVLGQDTLDGFRFYQDGMMRLQNSDADTADLYMQLDRSIQAYEQALGANHARLAQMHFEIGKASYLQQYWSRAIFHLEQSATIRQQSESCDSLSVVNYRYIAALKNYFSEPEDAIYWSQQARKCFSEIDCWALENLGILSKVEGESYRDLGQIDSSVFYLQQSARYRIQLDSNNFYAIGVIYNSIGATFQYDESQLDSALYYITLSLEIFMQEPDQDRRIQGLASSYTNLGLIYNTRFEFKKAIGCFEKALAIKEGLGNEWGLVSVLMNLANSYVGLGNYQQAKNRFERANNILLRYDAGSGLERGRILYRLADIYLLEHQLTTAMSQVEQAEDIFQLQEAQYEIAHAHIMKGAIFTKMQEYDLAEASFLDALARMKAIFGEHHQQVNMVYNHLTELAINREEWDKAKQYNQQATIQLGRIPSVQTLNQMPINLDLIESLVLRAIGFQKEYVLGRGEAYRDSALQTIQVGLKAIHLHARNMLLEDQLRFRETYFKFFETGIDVLMSDATKQYDLSTLQAVFALVEQSKATSIRQQQAMRMASAARGLPSDKLSQLQQYEHKTEALTLDYQDQHTQTYDTQEWMQLWQDNQASYDSLLLELKEEFQSYYQLKYNTEVIDLERLQETLASDQAMIEYMYGPSRLVILVITKDSIASYQTSRLTVIEELIEQLSTSIRAGQDPLSLTRHNQITYLQSAHELYNEIWKPITQLLQNKKRLLIVPDASLNAVPFDALLTEPVDLNTWDENFRALPYMINQYQISVQFSATYWVNLTQRPAIQNQRLLALAPSFSYPKPPIDSLSNRPILPPLKANQDEIAQIQGVWDRNSGTYLSGHEASLEALRSHLSQYGIYHFATHASANQSQDMDGYLAFWGDADTGPSYLYSRDIYGLNMEAEMVVLSACETFVGPMRQGEGIIGLAHAFAYAGSRSMVTSLWSVNDQATADLMKSFYTHLSQDADKDEALRLAKLDRLNSSNTHPFFWAGFIPTGNMQALPGRMPYGRYMLIAGLLLVLLLIARRLRQES